MRVPRKDTKKSTDVKVIHVAKPIVIPRLPVCSTTKQREKLIKVIEGYCRSSMCYEDLIHYLKTNVDMDQCTILENFKANGKRGMIEIHHAPYTLFSIVDIVMTKQEKELGYIDEFVVAEEVMRLHYAGLVGLVPLATTVHEAVHDGQFHIPLWCVYGKFIEFTNMYYDYIPEELRNALQEEMQLSKQYRDNPEMLKENSKLFKVQYVYLDVEGQSDLAHRVEEQVQIA